MIKCEKVQYKIAHQEIIKDFSLELHAGERVALIGPSGCGKSTILQLLLNTRKLSSGLIEISSKNIAYMPQNDLLLPWLTLGQNIHLPLEARNIAYDPQKMQEQLKHFKVHANAEQYPHELSGGMKSRVNLIRALNMSDELILLDEPFSKLDYLTHLGITDWFKGELMQTNLAMLLVTHNIDEAIKLCDRIIVLSHKPSTTSHNFLVCDYQKADLKAKIVNSLL